MTSLTALHALLRQGKQPVGRLVWIGLDFAPAKHNAIAVDSASLPSETECRAVAGLDVIVLYHGFVAAYGALRRLCGNLHQANPRRLQLIDLDFGRIAYLKVSQ